MKKSKPYPYYDIPELWTIPEVVDYGREKGKDLPAFYRGQNNDEPLTFGETSEMIRQLGTAFLAKGLNSVHVALIGENSTEWIFSFLAITSSGNVAVPLDRGLPKEDIAELAEHCDCSAIVYSEKCKKIIDHLQGLGGVFNEIMFISLADFDKLVEEGKRLLEEGNTAFDDARAKVGKDTLASIVYTSGTSGKMKGVMLSHGNIASDAAATCMAATAENTQLLLPLHHTFSWASAMLAVFLYVVDIHISGDLKRIVKDFQKNHPQNVSVVPMMAEMLYRGIWSGAKKQGNEKKLKHGLTISRMLMAMGIDKRRSIFKEVHENFGGKLELIICGGAAMDPNLETGLYDLGIEVLNGYGITECSPVVAVNRNLDKRVGSVGKPLPCNTVKIDDPDENGIGEICVSGSNVMLGYYKNPEATAEVFDGEWFRTGDYGRLDEDGFLFITGRKKNLIILANGENISPEELEMKLSRAKYVVDVVVYEENGVITAEFYLDEKTYPDARTLLDEDVKQFNRTMPKNKNIGQVKVRDIPFEKTTTMKIKRYLLGNSTNGEGKNEQR